MKMHELLGMPEQKGDVGIEIECEAKNRLPGQEELPYGWNAVADGSLRGVGMEYITSGVANLDEGFKNSLDALCKKINDPKNGLNLNSPRTSVHVHVNAGKFEVKTVISACLAWWLYEDYIISACTDTNRRKGNHFCFSTSDAEGIINNFSIFCENLFTAELKNENYKYAAQSTWSLHRFGSVEYRCMEGIYDSDSIYDWARMLYRAYGRIEEFGWGPHDLLELIRDKGLYRTLHNIYPSIVRVSRVPVTEKMVLELCEGSLSYVSGVANLVADWDKHIESKRKLRPSFVGMGVNPAPDIVQQGFPGGWDVPQPAPEARPQRRQRVANPEMPNWAREVLNRRPR